MDLKTIKCLVVDDEPMARDVIRRYIEAISSLRLVGEFGNAIDAMVFLQNEITDVIFLDIQMPHLNGLDFVKSLRLPPKIIFTTAHKEYALDGFELDVIDYLLKPISFERFLRAVNRAFPQRAGEIPELVSYEKVNRSSFIYLKVDRKMVKVILDDILYVESARDYLKVVTQSKTITTRQTISSIEVMLSESEFVRIHRSYIVSIKRISAFNHDIVSVDNKELPIGKFYLNSFLKLKSSLLR